MSRITSSPWKDSILIGVAEQKLHNQATCTAMLRYSNYSMDGGPYYLVYTLIYRLLKYNFI
jgi:hypothetical protein